MLPIHLAIRHHSSTAVLTQQLTVLYCDRTDLGTWLSIFRRALRGFVDCHSSEAVIQFSLNVCNRVDVLELRTATVDVASHLCGLMMLRTLC